MITINLITVNEFYMFIINAVVSLSLLNTINRYVYIAVGIYEY